MSMQAGLDFIQLHTVTVFLHHPIAPAKKTIISVGIFPDKISRAIPSLSGGIEGERVGSPFGAGPIAVHHTAACDQ